MAHWKRRSPAGCLSGAQSVEASLPMTDTSHQVLVRSIEMVYGQGHLQDMLEAVCGAEAPPEERLRLAWSHFKRAMLFKDHWSDSRRRMAEDLRRMLRELDASPGRLNSEQARHLLSELKIFATSFPPLQQGEGHIGRES
jgi:hypothetical protein